MSSYVRPLGAPVVQHENDSFQPPVSLSLAMLHYLACRGDYKNYVKAIELYQGKFIEGSHLEEQ